MASAESERGGEGGGGDFRLVGAINLPIIHYSVLWWRRSTRESLGVPLEHRQLDLWRYR